MIQKCAERPDTFHSVSVVNPGAFALAVDETRLAKNSQMVGNRWLCKGKLSFDIADTYRVFLPRQKFQDSHTYGMADGLKCCSQCPCPVIVDELSIRDLTAGS